MQETKEGQMSKKAFDKIAAGLKEAVAISRGEADPSTYRVHVPESVDVKAIRSKIGLTQSAFASRFGFPLATVKDWEQGRRGPETTARALLTIIDREPEAVRRALVGQEVGA